MAIRRGLGLAVGLLLAQIGEFSFILANLGRELKILPDEATNALVATAIVSISINPLLYRLLGLVESRARRQPRLARWLNPAAALLAQDSGPNPETADRHRVIVIGYGPVGRTLVRLLQENGFTPSIIDLNVDTVRRLRDEGLDAVYGDAVNQETLEQARCKSAVALILSASAREGNHDVIRLARTINPTIRVFARTEHLQEGAALRRAGADVVFASEGEVALSMTEYLLRQLGASAETD